MLIGPDCYPDQTGIIKHILGKSQTTEHECRAVEDAEKAIVTGLQLGKWAVLYAKSYCMERRSCRQG